MWPSTRQVPVTCLVPSRRLDQHRREGTIGQGTGDLVASLPSCSGTSRFCPRISESCNLQSPGGLHAALAAIIPETKRDRQADYFGLYFFSREQRKALNELAPGKGWDGQSPRCPLAPQKQQDPVSPLALPHGPVPSWRGGRMLPAPPAGGPRPGEVSAQGWGSLQHPHLPGVRSSEEQPGAAPRAAGAAAVPPPRAIPGGAGGTKQLPARFAQCGEEKDGASLGSRPPGRWKTQGGRLLRCLHPLSVRPRVRLSIPLALGCWPQQGRGVGFVKRLVKC